MKSSSKRKRNKNEIEEVKEEEKDLTINKQKYLKDHKRLKLENTQMEG
jgi:hypothetical protein